MKYTCIVAEDEELLLHNMIKKIEECEAGFTVVGSAQTGAQAYELIEQYNPDLVISDIRMPVMDGIELLKKVREGYPDMDFIFTTGYSDFEYTKQAIRYSASEYLLKPIDPDELNEVLNRIKQKYLIAQQEMEQIFNEKLAGQTKEQIAEVLKDYLVANLSENINLNLIAYNMGYSAGHLTKVFAAQYDMNPSKYLINLRMKKSQQMLIHNENMSVRQIGEAVGYPDQAYFSRIFKKYVGMSPAEYRDEQNT